MSSEEARLEAAREFMGQKKYDAARTILKTMPNNPQAQSWLITLDQLAPSGSTPPLYEDPLPLEADPYGQEEFLRGEVADDYPEKMKRAPRVLIPPTTGDKNYSATAVVTLILYIAFWPVGLVANIVYLKEARQLRAQGSQVEGEGCLVALLVVHVILPCALVLFLILVAPTALEKVQDIMTEINAQ